MPRFTNSIEYTDTDGSQVTLDGITNVSTVDASTLSVANALIAANITPNENGAVNPLGRKLYSVVGEYSTALGVETTASGKSSIAFGDNSIASADSSVALGRESTATGGISTALGATANASGTQSTALGYASKASGESSVALGHNSTASGESSVALGHNSTVSGDYSVALGHDAVVSGDYSVALGYQTKAVGIGVAVGYGATASSTTSLALGFGSTAAATQSVALGQGATVSKNDTQTMQLGDNTINKLRCKVNLSVTSDERDKADIEGITDALAFVERLNPVTFVSNERVEYISDEDKKGETFRTYGMCEYDRVSHAAGTKKGERRRCGLLAQEVVEAMQSVYGTDNYADIVNDNFHDLAQKPSDVENQYTLAYANLVPFLIGAIKELNAKIKDLEGKLATSSVAGAREN